MAGSLLLLVGNPLSLLFIADGINIAFLALADLVEAVFRLSVDYSPIFMAIGAVAIVLGIGMAWGKAQANQTKKLKKMKSQPTAKAGKFMEV